MKSFIMLTIFLLTISFAMALTSVSSNQNLGNVGAIKEYTLQNSQKIRLQEIADGTALSTKESVASTKMEIIKEQIGGKTKLSVKLSNGENSEIKIMPDIASEQALDVLRLNVCSSANYCTIELKEIDKDRMAIAIYEIQAEKKARLFGLFEKKMKVIVQIDARTGEIIRTKKQWWAFLATENEK